MNKYTIAAASVAFALGLTACSQPQEPESTSTSTDSVAAAPAVTLSSGIETANFDTATRAQDDFYRHVNGTWLDNTPIPADRSNYGSFSKLYDDSQQAMKTIIEAAAKVENPAMGSDEQKLGDFYKAWMDTAKSEALGLTPLSDKLAYIAGIENHADVASAMGQLLVDGATMPFGFYVNNDAKNSSEYGVYLYQSGLGLPDRDYYLKDDEKFTTIRAQYQEYIVALLTKAGHANPAEAATNILALETAVAEKQWSRVESRDANKTYNKKSADELNAMLGDFDWTAYATATGLPTDSDIIVRQIGFFEQFGELFSATDVAAWKDYMQFHLVNGYADYLSAEYTDLNFAFYGTTLRGIEEQKPRWKQAIDGSNDVIGEIVGKLYVAEYFKPEAKERMETMVANLIKAFDIAIDGLEWMSDETKAAAKVKLSKFTPKIGYPEKWKDYTALEIKADDLVGNYMRYSHFAYQDMLNKLGQPVDRTEWHMTPQTVNAYYNPVMNEIVFPAAILQPPFFNLEADDAVNYGGIGAVIGHEIGHGFDDQGAKYDGDGNLRNWWTEQDQAEFQARGKQLVEQYNAYAPFEDANVNGELTLGENIGDLGGLTVAYQAYQLSLNGEPEAEIDGFTGTQRFFMGWSQVWRRNYRDEELRNRLMTDSHSPSQYRVIGIVSNIPEFYQAFEVKESDEMYIAPEKRVKIW